MNDTYQSVNAISELVFWNHRFDYLSEVDGLIRFIGRCEVRESSPNHEEEDDILDLIAAVVALAFLLIAGICSLGSTWPRSVRRLIFCPTITATPTRKAEEENKSLKDEIVEIQQKLAVIQRLLEREKF